MASSSCDAPASRRGRAIRELNRGWELTRQLRVLLRQMPSVDHRREPAGALSLEVMRSLTAALRVLESSDEASLQPPQPPDPCGRTDPEGQPVARRAAGEKRQERPEKMEKRGGQHSRTEITPTPYLDGHQWRKYGQKMIAGSKFPRSYYRCTYSDEDRCTATKQIQQEEGIHNEPPMFWVKCNNEHTCRNRPTEPATVPCPFELVGGNSIGIPAEKHAWVGLEASNRPGRGKEGQLLSFSPSSSSELEEAAAPNNVLPNNPSCGGYFDPLDPTVLQPFMAGMDSDPSVPSTPEIVNDCLEDNLLGFESYDYFFDQLDLENNK